MTIDIQTNQVSYTGNGVATNFPFSFRVDDEDHLVVTKITIATEVEEILLSSDYAVNGIGDTGGGSIDLTPAISSSYQLRIERIVPYTQELDIANQDGFLPEVMEQALDALEMQIQQLRTAVLGITAPEITTTGVADFDTKADAEAADIDGSLNFLRLAGHTIVGDFGGALYKKAVSEPSHEGKLQSNDGSWWEISEVLINPVMFGGDLQAAVNISPNILIPAGVTVITSTVEYPSGGEYGGGTMRGQGMELSAAFSTRAAVSKGIIAWDGANGGTMIELDGQAGLLFEQISFVGKAESGDTDQAGIGHHWRQTGSRGAGESFYHQCSFQHMDTAVKFADADLEGTCAGTHFLKCTGQSLDTFMHVTNDQGLNYVLDHCSFNLIDRVCLFTNGGNLDVRHGNLAGCGTTNWCYEFVGVGINNYASSFSNLRIEQNTQRLLKATGTGVYTFENLTEAQLSQDVTMFDLTGGLLIIRDSHLTTCDLTNPTIKITNNSGGSPGFVFIENTHFSVTAFNIHEWISRVTTNVQAIIVIRNCFYGANFLRIPDYTNSLAYGKVVMRAQTTNTTPTLMTIDGLSRTFYSLVAIPLDTYGTVDVKIDATHSDGTRLFSGVRRCAVKNDGATSTLDNIQIIGTDYDPNPLGTLPAVTVNNSFDAFDVTVVGLSATTINWTATFDGHLHALL